jgi:hypothetical protein
MIILFEKKLTKKLFLMMILTFFSCSNQNEINLINQEIIDMALKVDPTVALILPDNDYPAIDCKGYGEGCQFGLRFKYKSLYYLAIKYDNNVLAKRGAKKIKGLFYYNWVFDDVVDEPVLEKFIEKVYQAKRP